MPKDPQDDAPFTLPADGADTPPSIPEPGQAGEQSKVRVILGLLKRIGDSPDEFERILSVLRFAFSKELKFVRQRIGKPYNSALDDEPLLTAAGGIATPSGNSPALGPADGSDEASFASKTSARVGKPVGPGTLLKSMSNLSLRQGAQAAPNGNGNENSETTGEQVVVFLSWIGKPKFALEGVVFSYNPDKADEKDWSKIKQVPSDRVVANIEGSWRKQIKYRRKGEKEWVLLIDLAHLGMTPRSVRPLSEQEERESRRLWDPVTTHMNVKNWSEATKQKQSIEQRQRDIAHELKQKGIEHQPVYFEQDISSGKPTLSEEGRKAVEAELERARREQA
ncbi:hypothetical protein QFC19_008830 [Naganishia cerealis]|uniref:Uncharacterized protein n=1 Tax=Naganishia cerealis TaxID=610337 RepID=A0ACC2UZK6_9TREE|nr:hypothetical protein QFC19_008830 [Naganishia cerealis]